MDIIRKEEFRFDNVYEPTVELYRYENKELFCCRIHFKDSGAMGNYGSFVFDNYHNGNIVEKPSTRFSDNYDITILYSESSKDLETRIDKILTNLKEFLKNNWVNDLSNKHSGKKEYFVFLK